MHLDILIFAVIAGILIYRLNAVLGTRHEDDQPRPNPFASPDPTKRPVQPPIVLKVALKPVAKTVAAEQLIDATANTDGRIETGLEEIAAVDAGFNAGHFVAGAKYAFETIVTAYAKGDRAALKPLLSPKLYADFDHGIAEREMQGHVLSTDIQRIKSARILEAHLGGTMSYITIDYDVEQTTVTRDKDGGVVEGSPEHITSVEDIWTFTRDTRSSDPNWILIETKTAEKPPA